MTDSDAMAKEIEMFKTAFSKEMKHLEKVCGPVNVTWGVLQWFTGNIGLHHVHHLGSRIPNYHLQRCHDENPLFQIAPTLTLWQSLRLARLALWDEAQRRLVSFSEIRDTRAGSRRGAAA